MTDSRITADDIDMMSWGDRKDDLKRKLKGTMYAKVYIYLRYQFMDLRLPLVQKVEIERKVRMPNNSVWVALRFLENIELIHTVKKSNKVNIMRSTDEQLWTDKDCLSIARTTLDIKGGDGK